MTPSSDAALKEEIARLTGAINSHKSAQQAFGPAGYRKSSTYVNPNYKPPSTYKSQSYQSSTSRYVRPPPTMKSETTTQASRDVVIDGITFESSSRSLVRKDRKYLCCRSHSTEGDPTVKSLASVPVPKPTSAPKVPIRPIPQQEFSRTTNGHRIPAARDYKSKVSSRTRRPRNRNMTLDNTRGPTQGRRAYKRMKYIDKPCPRFTTTGTCGRGLTCMYQHDPDKIAICWNFLHGNCSNTAETCNLSHDPTPERTPLCVHFAKNGRCTRESCPFPHVRVGQRHGVCRDFAVLGYCAKGLDCEMQHVRECPDFAEKGTCSTKGCKLPHVIRANRNRKVPPTIATTTPMVAETESLTAATATTSNVISGSNDPDVSSLQFVSVKDAQLGDEFISLVFNESEDEHDDDDSEEDDDNDAEEESEEGISPTTSPLV